MAKRRSKSRRKTGRRRTAAALAPYTGTASIAGFVSGEGSKVELSSRGGDRERHAVFSFTRVQQSLVDAFVKMATESSSPVNYPYQTEPSARQVAEDFVSHKLGTAWAVGTHIASCWTPTGWQPPQGDKCQSFELRLQGGGPSLPLHRYNGSKLLYLRFAVSVRISP